MQDDISKILAFAIQAPSGENCQPWRVEVSGDKLELHNVPERDQSLYNVHQLGSMVSHGAFLESLRIVATSLGYECNVSLFPKGEDSEHIASVSLSKSSVIEDPLFPSLSLRATNRQPYATQPLTKEEKQVLQNSVSIYSGVDIKFIESRDRIESLAQACSLNERMLFENQVVHDFFYKHVNWTQEEDKQNRAGFFIDTLELRGPQLPAFKLLKHWRLAKLAQMIGMPKKIAQDNAKTYSASQALVAFVVPTSSRSDFVKAGMVMQRLWLSATQMGLSAQPMTGVLFFHLRIQDGLGQAFSPDQQAMIQTAYNHIAKGFGVESGSIAMLLRLGRGPAPSARSSRFELENILQPR